MIKQLLNESLLSVYRNEKINEGTKDHPEALASCVSPQQLAKEMNAELNRKKTVEKNRGSLGTKKVIYHQKHIEDYIKNIEGEFDVFPLYPQEKTKTGKPSKKQRKVNYNVIVGSFNKELGFIPNELGVKRGYVRDKNNIPVDTVMAETAVLDVEKFKSLLVKEPSKIFDRNPKMEKGDKGRNQYTINTGLPAIKGIVFDEDDNEFMHINTCPGAGDCQLVCYARGGFYGMNNGKILKLMRRLNLLWNKPKRYYQKVMEELIAAASSIQSPKANWDFDDFENTSTRNEGPQLVIRWNDAGDFFSETYFKIAKSATLQLVKLGYDVKSYAYTKQAKYIDLAGDAMIMNFSKGSKPSELAKVDLEKVKYSDIVPSEVFKQVFVYKGAHIQVDNNDVPIFKQGGRELLKQLMSKEYNIPMERLKYQDELPSKESEFFQYDVIVLPKGDSDIGAQRNDVHKTFLLVH
jgi:hypothetical protein